VLAANSKPDGPGTEGAAPESPAPHTSRAQRGITQVGTTGFQLM